MGVLADATWRGSRVALVHDFLVDLRGAERVFLELCAIWPTADVFTAVYDEAGTEGRFADRVVRSSFLQRLRPSARTFRALFPFYPAAIESLDLSGYDLVVSSSSAWAHGVICEPGQVHLSYCHNPFRYAWSERERTLSRLRDPLSRGLLASALERWRRWDTHAALHTDRYVANSRVTQTRVRQYFQRESDVVYPPVDCARFSPLRPGERVGDHYAIVSELMAHKRIDQAVEAFNRLGLPLIIVGDGPEAKRLSKLAGPTVKLTGRISDDGVVEVLQSCRALILTSVEEFGIAAVECQAAGRPVIARAGGGALETVVDGKTGCFWNGGSEQLAATVLAFDDREIDPQACIQNAHRFDTTNFQNAILSQVQAARDTHPPTADSDRRRPIAPARLVRRATRGYAGDIRRGAHGRAPLGNSTRA